MGTASNGGTASGARRLKCFLKFEQKFVCPLIPCSGYSDKSSAPLSTDKGVMRKAYARDPGATILQEGNEKQGHVMSSNVPEPAFQIISPRALFPPPMFTLRAVGYPVCHLMSNYLQNRPCVEIDLDTVDLVQKTPGVICTYTNYL